MFNGHHCRQNKKIHSCARWWTGTWCRNRVPGSILGLYHKIITCRSTLVDEPGLFQLRCQDVESSYHDKRLQMILSSNSKFCRWPTWQNPEDITLSHSVQVLPRHTYLMRDQTATYLIPSFIEPICICNDATSCLDSTVSLDSHWWSAICTKYPVDFSSEFTWETKPMFTSCTFDH